jgi:hypothetical protein
MHKVRAIVDVKTTSRGPLPVRGTMQTGFLTHFMHEHNCPATFSQQRARSIHSHNTQFPTISAQERLRNSWGTAMWTAEKRSSAQLALLLHVMNDRGKFHSHRARHRGGWAELVWWGPRGLFSEKASEERGPIVAYVAACSNASEMVERRLSITSETLDQSCTPYYPWCVHPSWEVSWPVGKRLRWCGSGAQLNI